MLAMPHRHQKLRGFCVVASIFMNELPTISIVVPNYNGAATLGETLDSLKAQNYPKLEVLMVDGGSTDGSRAIIESRAREIAWWVSEKDRGQSHALNKGFERATGDVLGWLNSDDILLSGALAKVGAHYAANPRCDVLSGVTLVTKPGTTLRASPWVPKPSHLKVACCRAALPQQSTFFHRRVLARTPLIREDLHYTMDIELWCWMLSKGFVFEMIGDELAEFRDHPVSKTRTGQWKIFDELELIYRTYRPGERVPLTWWSRHVRVPVQLMQRKLPRPLGMVWKRVVDDPLVLTLGLFYGRRYVRAMEWAQFLK